MTTLSPERADRAATVAPIYARVIRAAAFGLVVDLALGIVKLVAGLISGSFALLSDALNSLGDAVSTVVVLAALYYAQQPPDEEHPYGHSRAEGIAATNVALLIILSALWIAWQTIGQFGKRHELPPTWTLWIAAANVLIKEGLYRYKATVGERTGSAAILANAWDHRSDALCSLAVLIGLALVRFGGPHFVWADEIAALIVVVLIVLSGVQLFRKSASELMDVQADDELVQRIRDTASSVPGVLGVEKLWVRKSGLEYFGDIHIEVAPQTTVAAGHEIGHRVKDSLLGEFRNVRDVLVHLEPHEPGPQHPN
ncbi:MAG TPA: cation diffusion facilitator family transporter [Pirellulaceae bacterium]|nr:cation diffusion facilitator family transporter [Pirellulaceae bacterium]